MTDELAGGPVDLAVAQLDDREARHLSAHHGETLCGRNIRGRPIRTHATAAATADALCDTCRRVARDRHERALMRLYEAADELEAEG